MFTRKSGTDVSFMACAKAMLAEPRLFPAFATHNALTVATVLEWAGDRRDLEFQRLHGMGEGLYESLMDERGLAVRVYAPVGGYRDLLAYLVRRLLENGANTSFVHQIADRDIPDAVLLADPVAMAEATGLSAHPAIPRPAEMLGPSRRNSEGIDLSDDAVVAELYRADGGDMVLAADAPRRSSTASASAGASRAVLDPGARPRRRRGRGGGRRDRARGDHRRPRASARLGGSRRRGAGAGAGAARRPARTRPRRT